MVFSRHSFLFGFFVVNTAILCGVSIFFGFDCSHFASKCSESVEIITYIFVCSAVIYGVSSLLALTFLGFFCHRKLSTCRLLKFLMTMSSGILIFSVAAGIGMLISLFFSFDPSALEDSFGKANFVLLWVTAGYSILSNAAILFLTLFFGAQIERKEANLQREIYVVPEITSVKKVPIV